MSEQEKLYYIQSRERVWGDDAVWWGPKRCGYTSLLDEAGKYTEAEAAQLRSEKDVPLLCAEVDAVAHRAVGLGRARDLESKARRSP